MALKYRIGPINGVLVRELSLHRDQRGWLVELFRNDELPDEAIPAMSYVSSTKPGITRGPHEHRFQADLFCFIGPSTFRIYLWDARADSSTYGNTLRIEAGAEEPKSVFIPAGVVHAYKNIGTVDGWVVNLPNRLYAGRGRREAVDEIRHENDPQSPFSMED